MGIHVEKRVASFGPYSTPQKEKSVSQALLSVGAVTGREGAQTGIWKREGNELQIELSASRICRSTGAKTNVAASDPHSE